MSLHAAPRARPRRLPRRRQVEAALDLADLQGNLLRGYTHPVSAYVFVRVADAARGREWLRGLVDRVTSAQPWTGAAPEHTLNLALTAAGLTALGVPAGVLATFPEAFRDGMAARAELLGDRGDSAPSRWDAGFGTGDAHVLVSLYGAGAEALERARAALQDGIDASGGAVTVVHEQAAGVLEGGRDHFGFKDGIAQPALAGSGTEPRPGDGLPERDGGWRAIRPGEFVLGYEDEDGGLPVAPAPPFDRSATFVVYRRMHMHVARMRAYLAEAAHGHPGGAEHLAAKLVGRWPDGTPLIGCPHGADEAVAGDPRRVNDFRYADDPDGIACPVGAHIRRANPRDHEGFFDGKLSNRHRIIRRGRAYGEPLEPGLLEDDGEERGLVFKCFNADIERQFEVIQSRWVDDGDPFGLGDEKDPLIGGATSGTMVIQSAPPQPPTVLTGIPAFTTMRGGEYLVRPGLRALRWLAAPL
jgi:Dyp-type peroxidase family